MIRTYGLTRIGLAVRDLDRSFRFYESVFGVREVYRDATTLQVQTPGSRDVIVFEREKTGVGTLRGATARGRTGGRRAPPSVRITLSEPSFPTNACLSGAGTFTFRYSGGFIPRARAARR